MVRRRLYLVSHSHLDVVWIWPLEETRDVLFKTVENVLRLMKKYPNFTYIQSTALYYDWLREFREDLLKEVKEAIKSGRWEVTGGSWVECDCNLPSGEGLVRQFLYGKRFFREVLGIDVKVAWFPDSFGFPASLPQILRGCGIKYFVTQKLNWNDAVMFPYNLFWWVGCDGSEVLAYQTLGGYWGDPGELDKIRLYFLVLQIRQGLGDLLLVYGKGDHGGGPREYMVANAEALVEKGKELGIEEVKHAKVEDFMRMVEEEYGGGLPKYSGELYLQFHRGTYTSQVRVKELVKECEYLLEVLEKLLTIRYVVKGVNYDRGEVERLWRDVLTSHFHDVLAGSVSKTPYEQFLSILSKLRDELRGRIEGVIKELVGSEGGSEEVLAIFNPLPRTARTYVEVGDGLARVEAPPLTLKVVPIKSLSRGGGAARAADLGKEVVLENSSIKVVVDKGTGKVVSLYSKDLGKELLGREGIRFEIYEDVPSLARATAGTLEKFTDYGFDCWELYHLQRIGGVKYVRLEKPSKVEVVEEGGLRASVLVEYRYVGEDGSEAAIKHYLRLYDGEDWVEGVVEVDWRCEHKLLKLAMDLSYWSEYVAAGQPYGYVSRRNPASPYSTLYDRAAWEAWFSNWLDYSNGEVGLAVICGTRFGYDVMGKTLRLTLLRAPRFPPEGAWGKPWTWELLRAQEVVERGKYVVTYYLYPHRGDWGVGKVPTVAEELVLKPYIAKAESTGEPKEVAPIKVIPPHASVPAIKLSEDSDDLVIRLFNPYREEISAEVSIDAPVEEVSEANLLEELQSKLSLGSKTTVKLSPLKIKTLRIKLGSKP